MSKSETPISDIKIVRVNSVRWLCPKCYHPNAACPSALGNVFSCEKCGTNARVVMSKSEFISVLEKFFTAPESQLAPEMVEKLKGITHMPSAQARIALKDVLDECARASLASEFVMVALDAIWRNDSSWK